MSAIGGKATIREFLCSATIIIEVALPRNCSIIAQGVTGYRGAAYFRGLAIERKDFQCVGFVTSASAAAPPLAGGKAAEPVACRWAGAPSHQSYRMERRGASETGHVQYFQRAWLDILALKSSTLERNSFRIGDLFALL